MPRKPERSDLHGLLLLAKPAGPSSNQALQLVRRRLGWAKAGHAGTLDPAASGLLLVLLGEAVKLVPYLSGLEKEYLGRARFGAETDTEDAAGVVTRTAPVAQLSAERVASALAGFLGSSLQRPPRFSALKVGGERLYELARAGRAVEVAPRPITVSAARLLTWSPPDAEFVVRCSSGTYVRSLARDLGERCGSAAHLAALSRTAVGAFRLAEALTLEQLEALGPGAAPPLVRLADALGHLPRATLAAPAARGVLEGRAPALGHAALPVPAAPGEVVCLLDAASRLLAVARLRAPGEPVQLLRVFHEP